MAKIREVYELYGFEPVEQPLIEYTDALGKFLPDQDRPNEGVFSFQDDDDQWLSLRYDLTAPTRALRGGELRAPAEALSQLSLRLGFPQREAGAGPLPPVHAVRRRHGRHAGRRRRRRDGDDDGRRDGSARASRAATTSSASTTGRCWTACWAPSGSARRRRIAGRRLTVLRAIDKLDKFGAGRRAPSARARPLDGGKEGEWRFYQGCRPDARERRCTAIASSSDTASTAGRRRSRFQLDLRARYETIGARGRSPVGLL